MTLRWLVCLLVNTSLRVLVSPVVGDTLGFGGDYTFQRGSGATPEVSGSMGDTRDARGGQKRHEECPLRPVIRSKANMKDFRLRLVRSVQKRGLGDVCGRAAAMDGLSPVHSTRLAGFAASSTKRVFSNIRYTFFATRQRTPFRG